MEGFDWAAKHLWMVVVQTTRDGKNYFLSFCAVWTVTVDISDMNKKRDACTLWLTGGEMERVHSSLTSGLFLVGNYTLWRGQILSVDPWCWNFLAKPQEANWGHCRSATTGTEQKILWGEHNITFITCESKAGKGGGYQCREWRKGVNFGSGVCQNLLQPRWCIPAGDCSRQVKLWTWRPFFSPLSVLKHSKSHVQLGLVKVVAEAGGTQQYSKVHFPAEPPVLLLPWWGERGTRRQPQPPWMICLEAKVSVRVEFKNINNSSKIWSPQHDRTETHMFTGVNFQYLYMTVTKHERNYSICLYVGPYNVENVWSIDDSSLLHYTLAKSESRSDLLYNIILCVIPSSTKVTVKLHVRSSYNHVLNRNPDLQL